MMKMRILIGVAVMASALFSTLASAGVVISGTRVVFPSTEREVTVKLTNEGKAPALVQAWLDTGDANESPDKIDVPFMLTPSMFRLEPGRGQTLRIIQSEATLPADKESLFWLNVLEIPPKAANGDDRNKIQIAFRSRIKLMYRPADLPGSARAASTQLKWTLVRDGNAAYRLEAANPTPYVVNVGYATLKSAGKEYDAHMGYALPGGTLSLPVEGLVSPPAADASVKFGSIDDWGATQAHEQPVALKP
ncbi:molecular chaperone [Burkholderia ubonensis]|uniref:fimbrial biogenesis chaperone n=1 Tax=Burkholderia ubonensis TaxID=101571 RepID=UPI000AB488CC